MTEVKEKEIKYSYSRLDTYDQCPFRYWLKYIEGNYAKTGSVALEFGSAIHKVEEDIGNCIKDHKPIPYDELIKTLLDKCVGIQSRYPKEFLEKDKSGRTYPDKINEYVNTGIYRLENYLKANPDIEIIGCEVPFNFKFNGLQLFRGSIDRVLKNNRTGQYIVQDIKTYAVPLKDEPGNRDDHLVTPLQFVVYCIALSEMFPVDPTTIRCQYDLPLCNIVQDAGTSGFIGRGRTKLNKLFGKINEKDWTPKPCPLCHWCEFCSSNDMADKDTKFLCPYFSHWTKDNHDFSKENEWMGIENNTSITEAYHKSIGIK